MNRRGRSLSHTAERRRERLEEAVLHVGQPQELMREGAAERLDDCAHYRACLDYASRKLWVDFSCRACPDFDASDVEVSAAASVISASLANSYR